MRQIALYRSTSQINIAGRWLAEMGYRVTVKVGQDSLILTTGSLREKAGRIVKIASGYYYGTLFLTAIALSTTSSSSISSFWEKLAY